VSLQFSDVNFPRDSVHQKSVKLVHFRPVIRDIRGAFFETLCMISRLLTGSIKDGHAGQFL